MAAPCKYGPRKRKSPKYHPLGARCRSRREDGEVPLVQLQREIDAAFDRWCERRGLHNRNPDPVFEDGRRGKQQTPEAIARAYLAMEAPPHGVLVRMASCARVDYAAVTAEVRRLRKERVSQ